MSRTMKPRQSPAPKFKARGGTLLGMFLGLVIGVAAAAGVVWYMNKTPIPFVNGKPATATTNGAPGTPGTTPDKPAAHVGNGAPATPEGPLPLPGKPGDPIPEKRFQFYDILPGKAEAIPDPKPAAAQQSETKPEELKNPIYLQAGSFSTAQDADNQKAKLALIGLEAGVQQVMVQDKTYFRVRLGPYAKMDEANKIRSELVKAGIEATLVKKEQP
ncbi:MAG TPA: SPOR domain-containing protein [Rhodocyclaceae bacterium]|nr:SPOR domain-containing protein [Rhodocyclaceae bacterium]